jgi:hypothetical protein
MSYTKMSKNVFFVSVTVVPHSIFTVTEIVDVFSFTYFLSLYSFYVAPNSHWITRVTLLGAGSVHTATLFSWPQYMRQPMLSLMQSLHRTSATDRASIVTGTRCEVARFCASGDDDFVHLPHLWQRTIDKSGITFKVVRIL